MKRVEDFNNTKW